MKLTFMFLLIGLMQVSASVYSQTTKLSLEMRNAKVTEVLDAIENQSEFRFAYSPGFIDLERKLTVDIREKTIDESLQVIFEDTGVEFGVYDRHIILYPEEMESNHRSANTVVVTSQQQPAVSGTVTDASGQALPGVTVVVKGTTQGTVTNPDGEYSLTELPDDATLVFSFVGMRAQEVEVGDQTTVNVTMEEATIGIEEVVAIGYGTQSREQITGSVSSVSSEEILESPETDVGQILQGKTSGVSVTKAHTPGGGANIQIRGMTTINDNNPLWVVDGVPGATAQPNDIESISILKDASSTAIYGARGANGVILVTTKSGKKNTPTQVSFNVNQGINRGTDYYDLLNTHEYAELYWLQQENAGFAPGEFSHPLYGRGQEPDIPEYVVPARGDPSMIDEEYILENYDRRQADEDGDGVFLISKASVPGTDWYDVISRDGWYQRYDLNISGGSEKSIFAFGAGYLNEEAFLKHSDFERYNVRVNSSHDLTDWLIVGENLQVRHQRTQGLSQAVGSEGTVISQAYRSQPIIPVYDVMGEFMGSKVPETGNSSNPLAQLYRGRNNYNNNLRASGNFNVEAKIIRGLSLKTVLGFDYGMTNSKSYGYRNREHSEASVHESVSRSTNESRNWNWTNTIDYSTEIAEIHQFNLLAGTEAVGNRYEYLNGSRQDYFSPDYRPATTYMVLNSGTGSQSNSGSYSETTTFSIFGRLNYQFDNRYILNATFRRDGSSRFGPDDRYGNFPAFSVGWRVTEESFMEDIAPSWLDYLKLNGGYGKVGNDRIGNYNAFTTFNMDQTTGMYPLDGSNIGGYAGLQSASFGNPNAKWETTETFDAGVEGRIFGMLNLGFGLWQKNTTDMLYPARIPAVIGSASIPSINIAEMKNTGFDFDLNLTSPRETTGNFTYDISANISHYKNEITKLTGSEGEVIWSNEYRHMRYARAEEGTAFPEFYGHVVEGIFQTEQEAENHPTAFGSDGTYNEPGHFKYKDVNGDGVIDSDDRTYIGSPHPDFTVGLNVNLKYGHFDLSTALYASYGNEAVNYVRRWIDFNFYQGNRSKRALYESWGSPYLDNNENAKMPKYEVDDGPSQTPSTYFVEDASYLRMNNLDIGYTLPEEISNRIELNRVRIYARITNLFTITGYSGLDPEIYRPGVNMGQDQGQWPTPQQLMLGLNINM